MQFCSGSQSIAKIMKHTHELRFSNLFISNLSNWSVVHICIENRGKSTKKEVETQKKLSSSVKIHQSALTPRFTCPRDLASHK